MSRRAGRGERLDAAPGASHPRRVPTRRFELVAHVPVPPRDALDFLEDLEHHHGLHPFLVSARVVARGEDAEGRWRDWRVVERPALGRWHYPIRFPARVVRRDEATLRSDVRAAPGCRLASTTRAYAAEDGARLEESTVVTAPPLVVGYMARQAEVAHAQALARLPGELAG